MCKKNGVKAIAWHPSFGAALYMECSLNDHIGLSIEVLYSRFYGSWKYRVDMPDNLDITDYSYISEAEEDDSMEDLRKDSKASEFISIHTIGLPLCLVWNWTALVRPDFKKDYFHGRIFMGFHPFLCMNDVRISKYADGKEVKRADSFNKDNPRYRFGFIYGASFELSSGWLFELKGMAPYNLLNEPFRCNWENIKAFHLSVGYNLAKLYT